MKPPIKRTFGKLDQYYAWCRAFLFLQESLTNLLKTRRVGNLSECNQDFKKEEEKEEEEEESVSRDCTLPSI